MKCECGRPITMKPHCPRCGSKHTTGKVSNSKTFYTLDGESLMATAEFNSLPWQQKTEARTIYRRGFYCRQCTEDFFESQPCKAPNLDELEREKKREKRRGDSRYTQAAPARKSVTPYDQELINKVLDLEHGLTPEFNAYVLREYGTDLHSFHHIPFAEHHDDTDDDGPKLSSSE